MKKEYEKFVVEIEGEKVSDLDHNLISLEVELDDELAAMFRLRLVTEDGILTYLDDERFLIWNQVTIYAGFESGMEELITGYITHVKPDFGVEPSESTLEIWGMDGSVLMDREEKLKAWPNKKDSDIAAEIFDLYGFTPEVENTEVVHDEAISTIIQRETDIQFLRRLALRNGFECYVEGEAGYFRSMPVDATPQPILVLHDEDHRNVNRFSVEVNALTPANVTMFQVDRFNKQVLKAAAESNQQAILGGKDAKSLLAAGMNPGQVYIGMSPATGNPEMTAICQKLFHESEWFVTGEGEIDGNLYGHVLKPRRTVTIKGIRETYSGVYHVSHVTHSFTPDGYKQFFRVKRNAIMPTGSEDFSVPSGLGELL